MTTSMHPLPGDPDAPLITEVIQATDSWVISAAGDIITFAAAARNHALGVTRPVVLLKVPGRINKTDEHTTIRMALSPEDAIQLADMLRQSAGYFQAAD